MDFMHNGTKIELLASGKFQTAINGRKVIGPSLEGLKKQIDNAAKLDFRPFQAISERYNEIKVLTIIGVKPPRKNKYSIRERHEFIDADGGTHYDVILDTPENRKVLASIKAHREETRRIEQERHDEQQALNENLKRAHADDFAPKKPANGSDE